MAVRRDVTGADGDRRTPRRRLVVGAVLGVVVAVSAVVPPSEGSFAGAAVGHVSPSSK